MDIDSSDGHEAGVGDSVGCPITLATVTKLDRRFTVVFCCRLERGPFFRRCVYRKQLAISQAIRVVPHFPKQGIMFQDITTLLLDHKAFKHSVDIFVDRYRDMHISVVAGIEARGFMFGPSIALGIGAKFVPLRKPRKLPGEVISEKYDLEYGNDCLELQVGAVQPGERAIVIDDLVATGGTLSAAIRLLERVGAEVVECACVIGVPEAEVKGQCRHIGKPLYVLVEPRVK